MGSGTGEFMTRRKLCENPGTAKSGGQASHSVGVWSQTNQLSAYIRLTKIIQTQSST